MYARMADETKKTFEETVALRARVEEEALKEDREPEEKGSDEDDDAAFEALFDFGRPHS